VNFPPKQIGPWVSECLVLGLEGSAGIVLLRPDNPVPNGQKMH
jgi:tRNA-binding protein